MTFFFLSFFKHGKFCILCLCHSENFCLFDHSLMIYISRVFLKNYLKGCTIFVGIFIFKDLFNFYVFYLHVCLCTPSVPGVRGVQKRVLAPQELELQGVVNCLMWVLRTKLGLSVKAISPALG